ncbi:E3 ubiquitin-protein ligase RNF168 isoform X1 [Eleutherodactylus coqui]|uniref:E3 ubiquitin-protein ligase RNF168 isoform X1 n=1 Tax=Eleutherodactylus coqui TaxID=57060 RepID=UPI0034631769
MSKKRKYPLQRSESVCGICWEILVEPVTLPCSHTLCHPCFQSTVEKANLCCPYCRQRVSNWARKNTRAGTLIDEELWAIIQRQYPEECDRRARGQDTVQDDFEDGLASEPTRLICKPGEIRQEYEAEINKIEAERLSREEEERKASEEYIRKLLAEEQEEQQLEDVQRQSEEQLKRDEELAWMLNSDLNESITSDQSSIIEVPVVAKKTPTSKVKKDVKAKAKQSGNIERFLSPKANQRVHISSAQIRSEDLKKINSSLGSNGCVLDSDEDSMPSLSPQFYFPAKGREIQDSDTELPIPCLSKYSPVDAAQRDLQVASSSGRLDAETSERKKAPSNMAAMDLTSPKSFRGQGDCRQQRSLESMTSTPEQWVKPTKRALESPIDGDGQANEKRQKVSCLENNPGVDLLTERLMQQEETLIQRKMQEEQDRLLAMKLQKLLDKEQTTVVRHKGSPDEYKLRPKRTSLEQETLDVTPLNISESSESGDSSDENKKPATRKCIQQPRDRLRHSSSSRTQPSEGVGVLRPSNKQRTILDMFQRSSEK